MSAPQDKPKKRVKSAKPRTRKRKTLLFKTITEGLYQLRITDRMVLDLLISPDDELLTFLRIDGDVIVEIPMAGTA